MQDEESIVRAAQKGDSDAFSMLYEGHFDKVYRYMSLRVGDRAEAEDMTQQVFVKAFEALPAFKWRGAPFASWLFRIAHNQVVDRQRRRGKQVTTSLEEVTAVSGDDPEGMVETRMSVEQVVAATRRLTPAQREVIGLRFGAEMSTSEVARVMGKSEGAVKALQHSAVVALRKVLMRDDDG
ncbi:MAG: sigma-70 family RNA polymerase sigma factor [Chloroflexota bacterium]